jgi:hypothetical protein
MKGFKFKKYNGKYFGKFDEREEAVDYMKALASIYEKTEDINANTYTELARNSRKRGIYITPQQLKKFLLANDIPIRGRRGLTRGLEVRKRKYTTTLTVPPEIHEALRQFPNMSQGIEVIIRLFLGMPSKDCLVVFDDTLRVLFHYTKDGTEAVVFGDLKPRDELVLKGILKSIDDIGVVALIDFCKLYNYTRVGPNE